MWNAITPLTIRRLKAEESGAPPFRGNPRSLGGNELTRPSGEITHDLPPDRRVRIKQPPGDRSLHPAHETDATYSWGKSSLLTSVCMALSGDRFVE